MDNYKILPVDNAYNEAMLDILQRSPINANGLILYFDKSPDIFKIPKLKYSTSEHLGFFVEDELNGFGSLGYSDALVRGQKENVFTFYNFYLLPEARGKKIIHTAVKELFSGVGSKANYGISLTLKGNRAAESYIGGGKHDWIPSTRVIDDLVVKSILFALPKKNKTKYKVRNACQEDISEMVKLLQEEHAQRDFGLIFSEATFLSILTTRGLQVEDYFVAINQKGEVKGVCLAWDCSSFRNTTVLNYSSSFYPTLIAYKALEKLIPITPFPQKGESFHELTITDYAVADRDPVIMHALLSEIYSRNHHQKYHFMNWSSCGSDPLLKAAKGFWHKNITSHIIFTSMDHEKCTIKTQLPYIDLAFI